MERFEAAAQGAPLSGARSPGSTACHLVGWKLAIDAAVHPTHLPARVDDVEDVEASGQIVSAVPSTLGSGRFKRKSTHLCTPVIQ